ncbi:non-heme iron oxygenase ferredoxin subunit [Novosphingobium aerophilum]|uniref:Non-heme iron oxygenase ferredoxin subunit n=1 Tax=Novosphingobium aerophilum TaxID=2839843 RepID=A0A7X1KDL7_9SPHN|nr:non-heme iron oxygenase ferredoxin subunit [Novosphingobium aerophilum]MBC2653464.1 non-heme iron oxygenase ferredoxin subunit [Novosphingobium aerophilum]
MKKVLLCRVGELTEGEVRQVSAPGFEEDFAVYMMDGQYFASDDLCTHGMVSLSAGEIVDGQIFCPLHDGAFDIRTGKATVLPCRIALKIYAVSVEDGNVFGLVPQD